jgi:hypothetical protein
MEIVFHRCGHPLLNAGIIGVHHYLKLPKKLREDAEFTGVEVAPWVDKLPDYDYELLPDRLTITTEEPIALLEEIYYAMGREHYGTSTQDAVDNPTNRYYIEDKDEFKPFPRKKTYGFGALLTNDAAGKMRDDTNLLRQKTIKEDDERGQYILKQFKEHFEEHNLKLGAQLYLNEPYIKITRLGLTEADLLSGKKQCPITGEGFKKLQRANNVSPTASGLTNFMSGIGTKAEKVGWKALYLIRFVPVLALYRYTNGLDKLFTYVYDTNDLVSLDKLHKSWESLKLPTPQKQKINHLANFRLTPIYQKNADSEGGSTDFVLANELLFHLIYTINDQTARQGSLADIDTGLLESERARQINFYLIQANKFSGTMRPQLIERFTHFDRTLRIIRLGREIDGFDWKKLLGTLPLRKPNYSKQNAFEMSRVTRDTVLHKLMYGEDFTAELARFAYDCYGLRLAGENTGYKSWKQLALFTEHFIIHPNPTIVMDQQHQLTPEVREKAYNLGVSIGEQIMRYGDSSDTPSNRAKAGRKYTVQLNKARNYNDFLAAIVRLTIRFEGLVPSRDLLQTMLTEDNYESVKHLTVLGAMTRINSKLSRESAEQKTETQNA